MRVTHFLPLGLLALSMVARADAGTPDGEKPEDYTSTHTVFVGGGFFNSSLGLNAELVTRLGNFAGSIQRTNQQVLLPHFNWRAPIEAGHTGHDSGYYLGVFGGELSRYSVGGVMHPRLGGGFDLGYHWVNQFDRKIASVGLGTEAKYNNGGDFHTYEPMLYFSFSWAIGFR